MKKILAFPFDNKMAPLKLKSEYCFILTKIYVYGAFKFVLGLVSSVAYYFLVHFYIKHFHFTE